MPQPGQAISTNEALSNLKGRFPRWTLFIWVAAAIATAAIAVGFIEWRLSGSKPQPRFVTAPITEGPLQARVTANGTLSALVTVQVGSQVSGRVQVLDVDFNSPVKKGQRCAQIDPQMFVAAVDQAKANKLAAEGSLAKDTAQAVNANLQYRRERELREQNLVAQADLDTAKAAALGADGQVDVDRGALAQAEAALSQAKLNLEYTRIVSPIDGVVVSRNVDVGQTVAAAFQAPVLFLIAENLKKMQVDTSIAEADVGRLGDRMEATFTVDAYPNDLFRGIIRQIRKNPQTIQNVVTYDAVLDVNNDDLRLFPGMTANVSVVYADRPSVSRVPNTALRYHPPADLIQRQPVPKPVGDERIVWVLRATIPEPAVVHIGVSDGAFSEVLGESLKPGDKVVTENLGKGAGGPGSFGRVF